MVTRPAESNAFEFVILASLRAAQLVRGCTPRVATGERAVITAQREVAAGKILSVSREIEATVPITPIAIGRR